ncbi:MAG: hypothetical protein A2504_07695 [Bdellovibrionales bacterium RIFOXYD12_FULL_39_22]|nr:MAG: hypothetical protein A2385_11020 [Bdellovibrionales bacterium RIFOXYB1_FULL_39_21]OFZ41287.1 MAG: hypothetical protein A2485_00665 [Bdellovibrionales bacterium RIFOXYC12_FULL_39_17]OFZ45063.1 MAG: hypothetical protein A2404_11315 [Bdellovibrionales bacterium RIFOXYC1_FULL_39_130]OFZ74447.1 MAG: hypothetical protein A2560_11350 [Bdellovibrionales bacterium RIFOXYD1_FULL_39_84]OFZ92459.1 MAG: hypothetical protein A2504_07695 [Bdellovibrionales bacterium RIFOXYD12_FULL_39_22]
MTSKNSIIDNLIGEAQSYTSLEVMERMIQDGADLSAHAISPLYLIVKKMNPNELAHHLHLFSSEQRQIFLDMDLWLKDDLDVDNFNYWIRCYAVCENENIRAEFIGSSEFAVYLKGRFNIWTFDAEDPQYPEHDNYFLTPDTQLLVEFDEDYEYVRELKELIVALYAERGVEDAYAYLFKLVSDSFSILQEEEYEQKKSRMSDYGFVDYFEALEVDNIFPSMEMLQNFVIRKKSITGNLDDLSKLQALPKAALVAFSDKLGDINSELAKVVDDKRVEFLRFNFIKLVNATMSLTNALQEGQVAMTRVGNKTRNLLSLGMSYINQKAQAGELEELLNDKSIFDFFTFADLYKIGNTLIKLNQKMARKNLSLHGINEHNESFLGKFWLEFLDFTFDTSHAVADKLGHTSKNIVDMQHYGEWTSLLNLFGAMLPFIKQFLTSVEKLKKSQKLRDEFYINYTVEEIDFEAIILSNFYNYLLGNFEGTKGKRKKLGVTISDFKKISTDLLDGKGKLKESYLKKKVKSMALKFGLDVVLDFDKYFIALLKEHIEGYEFEEMSADDYKHVGGPIIFNILISS